MFLNGTMFLNRPKSAKVCFSHFKSCDHTLGRFQHYSTFQLHGTILHGAKYVRKIKDVSSRD